MDVFTEYLVKRRSTTGDVLKKAGLVLGGTILFLGLIAASFFLPMFSFFLLMGAAGVAYGVYQLVTRMNIEYEYIFTNGELDVDKIIARRKRKRLVSLEVSTCEKFAPYRPEEHRAEDYDNCILACIAPDAPNTYCIVFDHPTLKRVLLVFNPNAKILDGVKLHLPSNKRRTENMDDHRD